AGCRPQRKCSPEPEAATRSSIWCGTTRVPVGDALARGGLGVVRRALSLRSRSFQNYIQCSAYFRLSVRSAVTSRSRLSGGRPAEARRLPVVRKPIPPGIVLGHARISGLAQPSVELLPQTPLRVGILGTSGHVLQLVGISFEIVQLFGGSLGRRQSEVPRDGGIVSA